MKIQKIQYLDGDTNASEGKFGSKISVLSKLLQEKLPVPKGFYFSLEDIQDRFKDTFDDDSKAKLLTHFKSIINASSSKRIIVRSSMSVENVPRHQFPGIFLSVKDIGSFDELLIALKKCISSRMSNEVIQYSGHFGIITSNIRISVLVQEQITPSFFGIAHVKDNMKDDGSDDYIEVVKTESEELIRGRKVPSVFRIIKESNNEIEILPMSQDGGVRTEDLKPYLIQINSIFSKIKSLLKHDVIIEFAIDNNGLKIFQARNHKVNGADPLRRPIFNIENPPQVITKQILKDEGKYGLKGAAMRLFHEENLFDEKIIFIEPKTTLTEISSLIKKASFGNSQLTVRFSKGNEIGLPRFFAASTEEAIEKIASMYEEVLREKYDIIIHTYLDVARSYELLAEKDDFVLEHIPGLWEANNILEPDVLILDGDEVTILKVKEKRQKIISTPFSTTREYEEPVSNDFLFDLLNKVIKYYDGILKPKFGEYLPLNFHFIETVDKKIAYLNIRRLNIQRRVLESQRYVRGGSFFHVRDIEDLSNWDGKTPILLKISVQRGMEKNLINLAEALPKGNSEVYICFGYLSHPALLLREFGVNLVPAYFDREIITLKLDEFLNSKNSIERIFQEKPIIQNDLFHIVNDIEPICNQHLLVFPKEEKKSYSECNIQKILDLFHFFKKEMGDNYYFFERGNVSFCTSFDGPVYAHMHLLESDFFKNNLVENFLKETNCKKCLTLEELFENIENNKEYLIFGKLSGPYYCASPFHSNQKRFIRKILSNNLN